MDKSINYGALFAEVGSPIHSVTTKTLTRFSLTRLQKPSSLLPASHLRFVLTPTGVSEAEITHDGQLLKEQNKYDQIPLSLFYQLQRVLPLADRVADEIIFEETDILEEIMPRMFKVMQRVAEYSCDYVRRGHLGGQSPFLDFACVDDCSENGWRTGLPGRNRRIGEGLDQGHRRLRPCSEC